VSSPVSIIIPASDTAALEQNLPPLLEELKRRDCDDEVIVVDDTGTGRLSKWFKKNFPSVGGVKHKRSRGYGISLLSGAHNARHAMVFCLAPEMRVSEGFLEPLVRCLSSQGVLAVSPDITPAAPRSATQSVEWLVPSAGRKLEQLGVLDERAFLIRKRDMDGGSAAHAFEPVSVDPVDLCRRASKLTVGLVRSDESTLEYVAGPPAASDDDLEGIARARNALTSYWINMDEAEITREHFEELWHIVLGSEESDSNASMRALLLALEQIEKLRSARSERSGAASPPDDPRTKRMAS
jgi:glycosyltransferase involved in cell wall biosynthesis